MLEERKMIRMIDEHTIEVSLPNKPGYERIAMGCLSSFAQSVGFKQERIEDLKTAVAEACIKAFYVGFEHPIPFWSELFLNNVAKKIGRQAHDSGKGA